ncbi:MAG: hypothetical protein ACLTXR_07550 [Clostridia bacterium]
MEEKILTILLDMQVDIKDLKKRVINIEENEIPSMKVYMLLVQGLCNLNLSNT